MCPGGGYAYLSMYQEGTAVAAWLNRLGISAYLLKSRLGEHGSWAPFQDACSAMRLTRDHVQSTFGKAGAIGIVGFSAGGHLAASVCCHHEKAATFESTSGFSNRNCRPDFAMLLYPVITMEAPYHAENTRNALLGPEPTVNSVIEMSLHKHVAVSHPPTFIAHAQDDETVPVENAILYYTTLRSANVPAAMSLYPRGGHGFGMAYQDAAISVWPAACANWMRHQGVID
ncbi:alpha/beta hydrolase [Pelagicoccus enzymogenes]|uniref:alpha/beta hydrolase n=1 Tax=Pelagicoccus enzymogenes TaxID=2773457 RepID=UPI00280CEF63|nr:alpha/beta hydrolase [Pelagicoccus enzymogenes]MDQ8199434.1 alpha/beta hydrolase [Pelagicoccus enzymogenes]